MACVAYVKQGRCVGRVGRGGWVGGGGGLERGKASSSSLMIVTHAWRDSRWRHAIWTIASLFFASCVCKFGNDSWFAV